MTSTMIKDIHFDTVRRVQNFKISIDNREVVISVSRELLSDEFGIDVENITPNVIEQSFRNKIIELASLIVSNQFNWHPESYPITNYNYDIFKESAKKFLDSVALQANWFFFNLKRIML